MGKRGRVEVDEYSRTNIDHIYAIGDVTDRLALTPVAIHEAMAFVKTVFEEADAGRSHLRADGGVHPARNRHGGNDRTLGAPHGHAIDVYKSSFRPLKNTLAGRDERALFKLIVDSKDNRVLGCHIFGPERARSSRSWRSQ